jgi:hypothetical protein
MSATGLDVFDTTVDKTNAWLIDLMEYLRCSRHDAYIALRPTLHAFRDRPPSTRSSRPARVPRSLSPRRMRCCSPGRARSWSSPACARLSLPTRRP